MSTVVVTDSTACLPASMAQEHGVEVVPLHVVVGGRTFAEGVDITPGEVAELLRRGKETVSTSRPSPGELVQHYREIAARRGADHLVSVHLSSRISGTLEAAELAAATMAGELRVTVVDSRTLGMAMGYAVRSGADAAAAGSTVQEVVDVVRRRAAQACAWFYVDTLEYLRRGGRVGAAQALVGGALSIKPLLQVSDGQVQPWEKVRTRGKALARLEAQAVQTARELREQGRDVSVAVHHLGFAERAAEVTDRLAAALADCEVQLVELDAVLSVHTGPGTVAVVVSPA
ncbi:DegV family protein [Ornithinimicrobium sediminis]|uniref:DegV family protein n=1 Tax=Ornithinimicrobium sediminis TaxID=2904603 RepID=UPI001E4FD58A|nr:DegV family protein [Ornithinimicrobium sediminis]